MRKLQSYVAKYGPEVGPKLYHVLQSQAAHASVGARLRRKMASLKEEGSRPLPLFPGEATEDLTPALNRADALPSPRGER